MPAETKLMDHVFIKIDGTDLPADAMDDLVDLIVESSLYLPDMVEIRLHDERLKWVEADQFTLGKEVEISAKPESGGQNQVLFKGEITALEPEFGEGTQATLLVRGYDRSHRLHRGTYSQAFLQMTDSDLANRIAQDAGLRAQVDATNEVHDYVLQHNQTHMEFLTERARRIGYEFFVEDKTLYFRKPARNGQALELEWGEDLREFRPRLTVAEQVDEVIVKGWDPKACQAIVGHATRGEAEPTVGQQGGGGTVASNAFNSARRVAVTYGVQSQGDAETLAQAILDEISGTYIEADGVCFGTPDLRAGKFVKLSSLGTRFSGTYFVTAATHVYRASDVYLTEFRITGRRPDTLYTLIERPSEVTHDSLGPVVGVVTNNKDPDGWGRVKVTYPWLSDDVESEWARVVSPGAGDQRGCFWLPEVNDEVLVLFEQGDMDRPYVLGGLWNGTAAPPEATDEAVTNGKVSKRTFTTRAGHMLTFTDESDAGVVLETAGGHRLTLADKGKKVAVETAGGLTLTLDDSKREITLDSGGNLALKSGGNLSIEATGNLELKGQAFKLNANAMGEVKAGATLTVQGALVKIN